MLRGQQGACRQHAFAFPDVLGEVRNIVFGLYPGKTDPAVGQRDGLFDHDDAIGAGRDWRPGHDAGAFAPGDFHLRELAGAYRLNDLQLPAKVFSPAGKPVDRSAVKRRHADVGDHILRQHTAHGTSELNSLAADGPGVLQDQFQSFFIADHLFMI